MSKVIKSGHLKLESPRLISHTYSHPEETAAINGKAALELAASRADETNAAAGGETSGAIDLQEVTRQAEEIIRETEEMVKELLETARQEAEKIVKKAKEEAENLVKEGQEKFKEIREQGYNDGWQVGHAEGTKKAEEEMKGTLLAAQKTLEDAIEERKKIILGAEDEIIQLAVAIAKKIIGHEISTNQDLIVGMVQKALEKVRDREEISLRVNPQNLEQVLNDQEQIMSSAKGIKKMKVLADPDILPGGCVIETSNGTVDARMERQLREIEQSLLEVNSNG
ncbi:flagellar assembly protein FliH/type III secretion system HrpE [Thermincola ferriacetica]|uniref:Flagellar assembly protein FliH/type III secretion system HrpE n=1 Tax=Thermincola ferriacetica TaxID=281456 RepID=A0A0L6W5Y5_9FIRM|nr:FliH/SctL family protein [Thermincola ferriacetica]KNZ70886.1 flagellar assembly protein FliH/type III secretion system HrpE [Thermincola ferriacetica]